MDFVLSGWYLLLYGLIVLGGEAVFFIYVTPQLTKRAILKGLKSEYGKEVMKELIVGMVDVLFDKDFKMPVKQADGSEVNVPVGDFIIATLAATVSKHFMASIKGSNGAAARAEGFMKMVPSYLRPFVEDWLQKKVAQYTQSQVKENATLTKSSLP